MKKKTPSIGEIVKIHVTSREIFLQFMGLSHHTPPAEI